MFEFHKKEKPFLGIAGLGGGGGGVSRSNSNGGNGGSGIVAIKYPYL
jgi:hypothetical protein